MAKVDLLIFPFILFFRVSCTLFYILLISIRCIGSAYDYLFYQYFHGKILGIIFSLVLEFFRVDQWTVYLASQLLLFIIYVFYRIIQTIAHLLQHFLFGINFVLIFYWSLFGPNSKGRRMISIVVSPHIGMSTKKFTCNVDCSKIRPLWTHFNDNSNYQVQGAFEHTPRLRNSARSC